MDLTTRHGLLMASFGGKDMKLIYQKTLTSNYNTTLSSLYYNEIAPNITFGDYRKLCICIFENNTTALSNKINYVFFNMGIELSALNNDTRNGGMIRNDYTNVRYLVLSNDARCNAGTILKIYMLDV